MYANGQEIRTDSLYQKFYQSEDSSKITLAKNLFSKYANTTAWDTLMDVLLQGEDWAVQVENKRWQIDMITRQASIYDRIGDYPRAMAAHTRALALSEETGFLRGQAICNNNIAVIHSREKNYERAIEYYQKAMHADSLMEDWLGVSIDLSNIGEVYVNRGDFDLSIEVYHTALSILDGTPAWLQGRVYNNMGEMFINSGQQDSALHYLGLSIQVKTENGLEDRLSPTYNNLGAVFFQREEYEKAENAYKMALELAEKYATPEYKSNALQGLSEVYEKTGKIDKSLFYIKLLAVTRDSLFNIERSKKIAEMEAVYQLDRKEREIGELESQARVQKVIRNTSIVVGILVLAALLLVINRQRLRVRLAEKDKILEEERSIALKKEVDARNRELTTSTLERAQSNKLLGELQELLKRVGKDPDNVKTAVKKIRQSMDFNNDWESLKMHFEKVHPGFFSSLQTKFPDLTSNELRHCAYIRINLSTKDVARIMHVEPKSISMVRYRIKKKLGLNQDDNLDSFISGI